MKKSEKVKNIKTRADQQKHGFILNSMKLRSSTTFRYSTRVPFYIYSEKRTVPSFGTRQRVQSSRDFHYTDAKWNSLYLVKKLGQCVLF